jgi:hypothetical protein
MVRQRVYQIHDGRRRAAGIYRSRPPDRKSDVPADRIDFPD